MKKYIILSLVLVSGLLVIFNLSSFKNSKNQENGDYILVEIYEVPSYSDKGVHIHYGNGEREYIPFREMKTENHDENGDITLKAINNLSKEGYRISHMTSGLANSGMITKIFMTKK